MKTTVELSNATLRRVKALAAERGISMKRFFATALEKQIRHYTEETRAHKAEAPWMAGFGALSDLSDENRHILELIDEEFETLDPEDTA